MDVGRPAREPSMGSRKEGGAWDQGRGNGDKETVWSMARGWAQESARDGSDSTGDAREAEAGEGS